MTFSIELAIDLLAVVECLADARNAVDERHSCQMVGPDNIGRSLQIFTADLIQELCLCAHCQNDKRQCDENLFHCLFFICKFFYIVDNLVVGALHLEEEPQAEDDSQNGSETGTIHIGSSHSVLHRARSGSTGFHV